MTLKVRYQFLLLLFVVLGVYYPALFGTVNSVDDQNMLQNLLNAQHNQWINLFIRGGGNNYYRPVLMATFYADLHLWLLEESFLHLENVLLHAWNSLWVLLLAREIGKALYSAGSFVWAPFCAALLFALHPINTEPVNWISGRTDVLAGAFLFPAVWFLLRGLAKGLPDFSSIGALFFLCACLSKETAVFIFPATAFFCFWHWHSQQRRFWSDGMARLFRHYWSWGGVLILYFAMRYAAKPVDKGINHVVKAAGGELYSYLDGLRIFLKAGGFYVKKLFVPWPLNFVVMGAPDWYVGLGVVFIIAIILWLWRPSLLAMVFLTMACLLSSALLVPLLNMTWTPLAERYLYLPSAFFVVGLVFYLAPLLKPFANDRGVALVVVPVLAVFLVSTYQRNIIWQDNLTLYQDTDQKTPNFPAVRNELALALMKKGRVTEAEEIFAENKIHKNGSERYYSPVNNALLLWRNGQFEEAGLLFWSAVDADTRGAPSTLKKYLKLMESWTLSQEGIAAPGWLRPEVMRVQEELFERTADPFWLYRQGRTHLASGDRATALGFFKRAYEKAPDHVFYKIPAGRFVENLQEVEN